MVTERLFFVTSSFSADRAARLLEEEVLSYQFGKLRDAIFRAQIALENGQVWLENGRCYCASATRRGLVYEVQANACECPARALCYHRVARRLLLRFFTLQRAVEADLIDPCEEFTNIQPRSLTLH